MAAAGPAAKLLGDVRRFPGKHHVAAHIGTTPLKASAARWSATGYQEPGTAS